VGAAAGTGAASAAAAAAWAAGAGAAEDDAPRPRPAGDAAAGGGDAAGGAAPGAGAEPCAVDGALLTGQMPASGPWPDPASEGEDGPGYLAGAVLCMLGVPAEEHLQLVEVVRDGGGRCGARGTHARARAREDPPRRPAARPHPGRPPPVGTTAPPPPRPAGGSRD